MIRKIINCTGKHKILPYDQTQFITYVIEIIIGITPSAPDSYTVKIRFHTVWKKPVWSVPASFSPNTVFWNIVCSFSKNLNSINRKGKPFSPTISFSYNSKIPDTAVIFFFPSAEESPCIMAVLHIRLATSALDFPPQHETFASFLPDIIHHKWLFLPDL